MKKIMFIVIFAVVSLSMMATVRRVQMYDNPPQGKDIVMKNEVPTTVTYGDDTLRITTDSLMTVLVTLRNLDNSIFYNHPMTLHNGVTQSIHVNGIDNKQFIIELTDINDEVLMYGTNSEEVTPEIAAYHIYQFYTGQQVKIYVDINRYTYTTSSQNFEWIIYIDSKCKENPDTLVRYKTWRFQDSRDNIQYVNAKDTVIGGFYNLAFEKEPYQYGNNCNLKPSISVSNIQNDAANNTYAIIVGGGTNKYNNYEEYWNDCSFVYQTLTNRFKIPKTNISLFFGTGSSNSPSVLRADFQSIDAMSKDFDGDNADDNVQRTNVGNFLLLLDSLATITNIDKTHLFFFFLGDGGSADNNSYISFWEDDISYYHGKLTCSDFITHLSPIHAYSFNFFFGQALSDTFKEAFVTAYEDDDDLNEIPFVVTAANSGMCSNKPYHEFVYNWLCALNKKDIHQNNSPLPPFPVIPQNNTYDSNGDCQITMNEAYNYAVNHSSAVSSYYSYPDAFFNEWAFTTLAPDTCDLYVRDFANDSGAVPSMLVLNNSSTSPSSPDIYLRNTADGFINQTNQQPDFNNSQAYLYTKVHNRGLNEFMGGGVYIHAYWFVPSSYGFGGQWSSPINSDSDFGLIGVKEIEDCIEERNDSIQQIIWQIPNNLGTLVTTSLGYLVELTEDSTPHAQTASGFNQLYSSAANSNDITYRKILFGNITPFQSMYSVDLTKGDDENFIYEILSESGNENCTIEDNGDMLHVEINMEANSPDVQIYHVVQKSDLTGKLEDELTIQLDRVSASDSTVHEEETSSNSILSLSKDQSQTSLIVRLQNPATNDTQICVEYVTTSVSTRNYNLNEGQSEITIPVNTLTDGFYNVTLKINGLSVDTKKIY